MGYIGNKHKLNHSTQTVSTDHYSHIASLEGVYELNPKVDLFGKYALKFQNEKDKDLKTSTLIDMVTDRITYKFTSIFDVTTYYRIINDRDSRVIKQGAALESGFILFKHFRLGLGYNFLDYEDKDNSDEGYRGQGPYFSISAKM